MTNFLVSLVDKLINYLDKPKRKYYFVVVDWSQNKKYKILVNSKSFKDINDVSDFVYKTAKKMGMKEPSWVYTEPYKKLSKDEETIKEILE